MTQRSPTDFIDSIFAALACDGAELSQCLRPAAADPSGQPWVLCIDDDDAFSMGLKLRLEEHGVNVVRAYEGMEGCRVAFTGPAQVIILDYEMPAGNGEYVLRRLKENPATENIPVIVLTGHRDKQLQQRLYGMGAAHFMYKPYVWDRLWNELQRHLKLPEVASVET